MGRGDKTSFWHEEWTGSGILKDIFPLLYKIEKEKNCTVLERLVTSEENPSYNWKWKKARLSTEEDIERLCCEFILQEMHLSNEVDTWVWKTGTVDQFSVKSIRSLWESSKYPELEYKHWWNNWVPLKVNFLGWRAVLNRLPSKQELKKRQVTIPSTNCDLCNMAEETCEHILIQCSWTEEIWALVRDWCGMDFTGTHTMEQRIEASLKMGQDNKKKKKTANAIVLVTLWTIWKARNKKTFNGRRTPPWRIIEEIKSQSYLWVKNRGRNMITNWGEWQNFPFEIH
ncbi:hypothetical protein LXL04_026282 [Taraxacum kok-saghyz]